MFQTIFSAVALGVSVFAILLVLFSRRNGSAVPADLEKKIEDAKNGVPKQVEEWFNNNARAGLLANNDDTIQWLRGALAVDHSTIAQAIIPAITQQVLADVKSELVKTQVQPQAQQPHASADGSWKPTVGAILRYLEATEDATMASLCAPIEKELAAELANANTEEHSTLVRERDEAVQAQRDAKRELTRLEAVKFPEKVTKTAIEAYLRDQKVDMDDVVAVTSAQSDFVTAYPVKRDEHLRRIEAARAELETATERANKAKEALKAYEGASGYRSAQARVDELKKRKADVAKKGLPLQEARRQFGGSDFPPPLSPQSQRSAPPPFPNVPQPPRDLFPEPDDDAVSISDDDLLVTCGHCNAQANGDAKFCASCGHALQPKRSVAPPPKPQKRLCPGCGANAGVGDKHCAHCGQAIPPEKVSLI